MKTTVTVEEARKILGKDAENMSDDEIEEVISTLTLLARDTLETTRIKMLRKRDAKRMAELIHKMYKEERSRIRDAGGLDVVS